MKRLVLLLPVLMVIGLLVLLGIGLGLNPREVPSPLIGKPAPDFHLPVLGDAELRLGNRQLQGSPALLNVWASWCVACLEEHPLLLKLSREQGIPLYGLNYKDSSSDAQAWRARHGNPYRGSVQDLDGKTGLEFGVYGVPETFLLDADGVIRYKHIGPISEQDWQQKIAPLLAQLRGAKS